MICDYGKGPVYAIGNISVLKEHAKEHALRALMLVKADTEVSGISTARGIISLQEILDILPPEMAQYGTIAGIQLEGEERPTTLIIYSSRHMEDLRQLTYARLYTSMKHRGEVEDYLKKLKDQSYYAEDMLVDPIPVVQLQGYANSTGRENKPK